MRRIVQRIPTDFDDFSDGYVVYNTNLEKYITHKNSTARKGLYEWAPDTTIMLSEYDMEECRSSSRIRKIIKFIAISLQRTTVLVPAKCYTKIISTIANDGMDLVEVYIEQFFSRSFPLSTMLGEISEVGPYDFETITTNVQGKSRKLKATWTIEKNGSYDYDPAIIDDILKDIL